MNKEEFFEDLYRKFNARDIEKVLVKMTDDVKWANGMEGGFVHGQKAVREYWTEQFTQINAVVEPQKIESGDDDKTIVTVHQTVKDTDGNLLEDTKIKHIFRLENELIKTFEIERDGLIASKIQD